MAHRQRELGKREGRRHTMKVQLFSFSMSCIFSVFFCMFFCFCRKCGFMILDFLRCSSPEEDKAPGRKILYGCTAHTGAYAYYNPQDCCVCVILPS
uniref:Uncharacterized protein n=1 Tax=Anguilla anguilla TaxID=7936 RepID=A0A0E9PHV7_ANGAN